jgi:hypothetical protein
MSLVLFFPIVAVYRVLIYCERRPKAYIIEYYDIIQIGGIGSEPLWKSKKDGKKISSGRGPLV